MTRLFCLVTDQHAGLTGAQQVGDDRERNATPLDLEGPVALAFQDQHVAEAVAHQQVQETGTVPRYHGEPGGLVADRDAEGVLEGAVPVPGVDPELAGVFHQHGQIRVAIAVEVARHDRDGAVVDTQTVTGRCGQTELRAGEAADAVGDQDGEAVCPLIEDHEVVLAVPREIAHDQADRFRE